MGLEVVDVGGQRRVRALLAVGTIGAIFMAACQGQPTVQPSPVTNAVEIPADLTAGQALFQENCMECHGEAGSGTDQGPPLVHKIYEPSHHADMAFQMAAKQGVRAHHWTFGDMAPVPGVTEEEVQEIVFYIRYLQEQAGIR